MAYKLEHVYQSDGSELSTPIGNVSIGVGATNMEYDGRYLWVAGNSGVFIYEWWGAASDHEPDWSTLDELNYNKYDSGPKKKLRLVTYISIGENNITRSTILESMKQSGDFKYANGVWSNLAYTQGVSYLSPYWIKKCAGKMYVSHNANFNKIVEFDIQTQSYVRDISTFDVYSGVTTVNFTTDTRYTANSNLCVSGSKLWYVGKPFGDNSPQKLYSFDPVTNVRTATDIPAKPSKARTWLTTGYNGFVYVTNYNSVSITKFSDVDGSFSKKIRLNAFPTHAFTGPDRRIWVSSYGGMLTLVDYDDDQIHNDYGVGSSPSDRAVSLAVDPTDGSKIWFIDNNHMLVRHDLNTHTQIETGKGNDWNIESKIIAQPEQLWMSQPFYYQDENLQTHLVKPYMFLIQAGKLLAFKMEKYLYREVYATLDAQGAVTDPQMYFGE